MNIHTPDKEPGGSTRYRTFVSVTPGLEQLLADELLELVGVGGNRVRGGLELWADREVLWRVVRSSRLAESVRVRIGRFETHNFDTLEAGLRRLPWAAYLLSAKPRDVRVTCRRSALYHSGAVRQRVEGVLAERLGSAAAESSVAVSVRIVRDRAVVSVDAGYELYRRGYRTHVGEAPLRETLAAACVRAAGLSEDATVWDPFCGSGTLVLEALGAAPASGRPRHAFELWPSHPSERYQQFVANEPPPGSNRRRGIGTDIDGREIEAARANAEAATYEGDCSFEVAAIAEPPGDITEGAAVLTNLPYGRRTRGGRQLARTLHAFGRPLAARRDLGPVLALVGPGDLDRATDLTWRERLGFQNGGLRVRLMELEGRRPP